MYFWFMLYCLTLILNNIVMEPPKFEFKNIILGYSGFLISWEPNEMEEGRFFKFGHRIEDKPKDGNFSFSSDTYATFLRYKINALEENTLYEIKIQQYSSENNTLEFEYSFYMKTNIKTNIKPEKPDFNYNLLQYSKYATAMIEWFPCGREKNCNGKEAGTHFATKINALDRRGEYREENYYLEFALLHLMPGVLYEVRVISINNDSETESDPQEIFVTPIMSAVTAINVVSFPNASVLISWKPPKNSLRELFGYIITFASDSDCTRIENQQIFSLDEEGISNTVRINASSIEEQLFDEPEYQLEPGVTYTFSITPRGEYGFGFETRVKYTMPVDKED